MLKDMKRNIINMERGLTSSTNGLKVCTVAKVAVPPELTQQLADAKAIIKRVKQATKAEGRESATPDLFGKSPAQNLKLDAFEQYRKPQETGDANLESLLGL